MFLNPVTPQKGCSISVWADFHPLQYPFLRLFLPAFALVLHCLERFFWMKAEKAGITKRMFRASDELTAHSIADTIGKQIRTTAEKIHYSVNLCLSP